MKPLRATKSRHKSTVALPNDRDVVVVRNFDAPRALVFDAWTKPSLVQRWMLGPPGWTMPVCEMDVRVGGRFRWVWRRESTGTEMATGGVYREIVVPERIVCTEKFEDPWYEGESINTIELVESGGVTELTQTMRLGSRAARDGVLATGMEKGVARSYDRLEEEILAAV